MVLDLTNKPERMDIVMFEKQLGAVVDRISKDPVAYFTNNNSKKKKKKKSIIIIIVIIIIIITIIRHTCSKINPS